MIESHVDDATVDHLIGEIAEEFTQRALRGEQPDVEDYVRRHPAQAEVLRQLLPALQSMRPDWTLTQAAAPACGTGTATQGVLGDFRIVREIGRGGMGIVYEAVQLSLQRRVALKVLPLGAVLDERHRQRFQNEALAVARLDHPGIVDVVGVGCDRGVHYYAMRYIEGRTLAQITDALRGTDADHARPDAPESRTVSCASADSAFLNTVPIGGLSTERQPRSRGWYGTVAGLGRQVAEALDHAHQNGIVHRDVKPSNLIVDTKGKAWICDFGLAHMDNDAAALTQTGDVIGTLRFMSPEQLTARRVVLDHRIDVYALGATLYELVTRQPAFTGSDREELVRRILFEEPRRPRKIDASVPAELETIVLKAMAKDPEDRYHTAQDLADDLQRFLDDKPIRAKRPRLLQRLSRWSRHHKSVVRSAAAVALIGLAGLTIAVISVEGARRDAVAAKDRADEQAELAKREREKAERLRLLEEQNFRRALQTVDLALTRVSQKHLVHLPGMIEIRRELLEKALELYGQFLEQRRGDIDVRLETIHAQDRVAKILLNLGRRDKAEKAYRRMIALAEGIPSDHPDRNAFRIQAAAAFHNLGMIFYARGQSREAQQSYRRSLEIGDEIAGDKSLDAVLRKGRAATHNNLGNVLFARGNRKQAADHYRQSIAAYKKLVKDHPHNAGYWQQRATAHCSLARYLSTSGRRRAAERHFRYAQRLQLQLTRQAPHVAAFRRDLARTHSSLGGLLRQAGKFDESKRQFESALEMQRQLFDHFSSEPQFLYEHARTHDSFSLLLRTMGQFRRAEQHLKKALEIRTKLVADAPEIPRYRIETATSRRHLATVLKKLDKPQESLAQLQRSRDTLRQLVTENRKVPAFRVELAETLLDLGKALQGTGKGETHLRQAFELLQDLDEQSSSVPRYRTLLGEAQSWQGILLFQQKKYESAAAQFRQVIETQKRLVADFPAIDKHRGTLASGHYNLALIQFHMHRREDAERSLRRVLDIYEVLMRRKAARYRVRFRATSILLGGLLKRKASSPQRAADLLVMVVTAWKQGKSGKATSLYGRATEIRSRQSVPDPLFDRLLIEVELLTGFNRPKPRQPVEARRPR